MGAHSKHGKSRSPYSSTIRRALLGGGYLAGDVSMTWTQPDLFGLAQGEADIQAAHTWRVENAPIYYAMLRRAQAQMADGQRVAIDELFNWARYSLEFEGKPGDYKLNNNLRAPLARLMIADFPQLADFMETRDARSDLAMGVRGK